MTVSAAQDDDAADETATVTHTVTSTNDSLYNSAAATSVSVTVDDDETANQEITLTMPAPVHGDTDNDGKLNLGDTLTYTATVTNSGNLPLTNVTVSDLLLNTTGESCSSLALNATCVLTGTYTITQADVDAGKVTNTVSASATDAQTKTITKETLIHQNPALSLEKRTTSSGYQNADDTVPYSYKVTNTGTVTLDGTLEIDDDKLTTGINCPDVPDAGLTPGSHMTCSGIYTVVQADVDASGVTNKATATLDGLTTSEETLTVNWISNQGSNPQISIGTGQVDEDAGSITLPVSLNQSSLQTVTVDYATSNDTAAAGADYTAASGTVTFSPGDTSKDISVSITDDDLDEDNETFKVTLSNPSNGQIASGTGEVSITITDDDTARRHAVEHQRLHQRRLQRVLHRRARQRAHSQRHHHAWGHLRYQPLDQPHDPDVHGHELEQRPNRNRYRSSRRQRRQREHSDNPRGDQLRRQVQQHSNQRRHRLRNRQQHREHRSQPNVSNGSRSRRRNLHGQTGDTAVHRRDGFSNLGRHQ